MFMAVDSIYVAKLLLLILVSVLLDGSDPAVDVSEVTLLA